LGLLLLGGHFVCFALQQLYIYITKHIKCPDQFCESTAWIKQRRS